MRWLGGATALFIGRLALGAFAQASAPKAARAPANWPHWGGPQRNDIVQECSGLSNGGWQGEKSIWEADVGEGSTSPLVIGDRLYVMGREKGEDHVRCLDANTGEQLLGRFLQVSAVWPVRHWRRGRVLRANLRPGV
jgi:hypothetical protein